MELTINNKVFIDYRDNIHVDKDNPILAFKANRDRYIRNGKQDIYAGLSHIGSKNSEDAITWNYFRSLELQNSYNSFENLIGIDVKNPEILLWTLAFSENSKKLQFECGSFIRKVDGVFAGQITEPDVIIKTKSHFIVIECKLGEKSKYPNHLWGSEKTSNGPLLRKQDYFKNGLFIGDKGYDTYSYQLFRMAYYTYEIGKYLKLEPLFLSLTNKTWWDIKKNEYSANSIWTEFCDQLNKNTIETRNYFWQDINESGSIGNYIKNHICL
jgi:hypothetical protein